MKKDGEIMTKVIAIGNLTFIKFDSKVKFFKFTFIKLL